MPLIFFHSGFSGIDFCEGFTDFGCEKQHRHKRLPASPETVQRLYGLPARYDLRLHAEWLPQEMWYLEIWEHDEQLSLKICEARPQHVIKAVDELIDEALKKLNP